MDTDTHSPEHARLGRAIRELRARRGLSQEELGNRSGLHRNYVGAIERGEINPTFRVLLKLERGLQLPLSEIIELWERRAYEPLSLQARRRRMLSDHVGTERGDDADHPHAEVASSP
jgi:transcriptional regulator with XRE-family HTH domain